MKECPRRLRFLQPQLPRPPIVPASGSSHASQPSQPQQRRPVRLLRFRPRLKPSCLNLQAPNPSLNCDPAQFRQWSRRLWHRPRRPRRLQPGCRPRRLLLRPSRWHPRRPRYLRYRRPKARLPNLSLSPRVPRVRRRPRGRLWQWMERHHHRQSHRLQRHLVFQTTLRPRRLFRCWLRRRVLELAHRFRFTFAPHSPRAAMKLCCRSGSRPVCPRG
jgi:hypothetical protein